MTDVDVGEVTAYPSTRPYIDEALFGAPLSSELRTLMAGGTSVDLHRRLAASLPATSLKGGSSAGRRQLTVSSSAVGSELALARQQRVDRDAHFRDAAEHGAELAAGEVLLRQLVRLLRQRHVAHFLHELRAVGQKELHELFHFGALCGRVANVDEQGARQRLIRAV